MQGNNIQNKGTAPSIFSQFPYFLILLLTLPRTPSTKENLFVWK